MSYTVEWDKASERDVEMGTDRGMLFPAIDDDGNLEELGSYDVGVPWNGLVGVEEAPEGGEATELYADNMIYGVQLSPEKLKLTIEHYSAPVEFYPCDGLLVVGGAMVTGQTRKAFGFSFRSKIGNALTPDAGYKLHIVWGCRAGVASKAWKTIGDAPEAMVFSHPISTLPVLMANGKTTAEVILDSRITDPAGLADVEAALYGDGQTDPELPTPDEIFAMICIAYVAPATAEKTKGTKQTQAYTCKDFNGTAIPCVWSIAGVGGTLNEGTTISEAGLLTIDAAETCTSITVTATPIDTYYGHQHATMTLNAPG